MKSMYESEWRFTIPLNKKTVNGVNLKTNYYDTIMQLDNIEDLNKLYKTEFDINDVDLDAIQQNQYLHDWIEENFPQLHELEYELSIWHHMNDIVDKFDGNVFKIATMWNGLRMLIVRYKNMDGYFFIAGIGKVDNDNVLKYVDRGVNK